MAEEFSFNISGVEEACAMLSEAPPLIAKNAFARAGAASARPIVAALVAASPIMEDGSVHHYPPPGALKAAVMTDIALDANGRGVQVQIGFGRFGFVARMVEYGHRMFSHFETRELISGGLGRKRYRKTGGHEDLGKPVTQQPFMRPVAASTGEAAIDAFTESLSESMAQGIPGLSTTARAA